MSTTAKSTTSDAGQGGWTRRLARDLFPGAITPFARTLLAAPAERALANAYAELGGQAGPQARFWHFSGGYAYLNSAAIEEADASLCGAAWLGDSRPDARGGLRARLQAGGVIRRCQSRLAALTGEAAGLQTRLSRWWAWVQGLKWSQADLLQVMEELEPHALAALQNYFLARAGLNVAAAVFEARLGEWLPAFGADDAAALALGVSDLPSVGIAEAVVHASRLGASDPERLATLARSSHRGPGEIRPDAARWSDAPELLAHLAGQGAPTWTPASAAERRQRSLAFAERSLNAGQFRELRGLLDGLAGAMRTADVAWDSLTLVMAAAQSWAGAAARETLAAGLIARPSDVLYLELEELKQVATGEWHAGDREEVQAAVSQRIGEAPVQPATAPAGSPVTVVPGNCAGPLYCDRPSEALPPTGSTWLAETADPGAAPLWMFAGCVQATGTGAWSPGMIVARGLGIPAVAGAYLPAAALAVD